MSNTDPPKTEGFSYTQEVFDSTMRKRTEITYSNTICEKVKNIKIHNINNRGGEMSSWQDAERYFDHPR